MKFSVFLCMSVASCAIIGCHW